MLDVIPYLVTGISEWLKNVKTGVMLSHHLYCLCDSKWILIWSFVRCICIFVKYANVKTIVHLKIRMSEESPLAGSCFLAYREEDA